MKTAVASLKSISPYSQSRAYTWDHPKLDKEGSDDYERRTWMKRLHLDSSDKRVHPPDAVQECPV